MNILVANLIAELEQHNILKKNDSPKQPPQTEAEDKQFSASSSSAAAVPPIPPLPAAAERTTVVNPILRVGDIVKRGPDWKWGDQDGGPGKNGQVTETVDSDGWIEVKWIANGSRNKYRYRPGAYDVVMSTSGSPASTTTGVSASVPPQPPTTTGASSTGGARTALAELARQPPTSNASALNPSSMPSLAIGDTVTRGPHWKWQNQDGGRGKLGTVVELVDEDGWVGIEWMESGLKNKYRYKPDAYDVVIVSTLSVSMAAPLPPASGSESSEQSSGFGDPQVGDIVTRGPDWKWDNQDGGRGRRGTVVQGVDSSGWVSVRWDHNGVRNTYRWFPGAYDVTIISRVSGPHAAPVASNDRHRTSGAAVATATTESAATATAASTAATDTATSTTIIDRKPSVGDVVVRGPDWKWLDQDGGAGQTGRVASGIDDDGWISVRWDVSGVTNKYRFMPDKKDIRVISSSVTSTTTAVTSTTTATTASTAASAASAAETEETTEAGAAGAGHVGVMRCRCSHRSGDEVYPLNPRRVHLDFSCKWQCCSRPWRATLCSVAAAGERGTVCSMYVCMYVMHTHSST